MFNTDINLSKYSSVHIFTPQAADVIIFLMDANSIPDSFGEKCLSCVVAQGIPTSFHVVQVKLHIFKRIYLYHIIVNRNSLIGNRRTEDQAVNTGFQLPHTRHFYPF